MNFEEAVETALGELIDEERLGQIIGSIKVLAEDRETSRLMLRELLTKAKLGEIVDLDIHSTIKKNAPTLKRGTPGYEDLFDGLKSALQSFGKLPL
ncbi:MAG: hypothetical protein Q8K86_07310 [Candidatus Nanopelagicaceae bacterium]|nr:hypothetical protein [Candidatus Nanopelagicaceae bacterium]